MEETKIQQIDYTIIFLIFLLMCFSLLAIYSGSGQYFSDDPTYFVKRQLIWFCIGAFVMAGLMTIDYDFLKNISYILYGAGFLLLLLVAFSPLGIYKNGALSWLNLGFATFQPSEMMKLFLIIVLAHLLASSDYYERGISLKADFIIVGKILAIAMPPLLLILNEPDLGTTLVLLSIMITLIFMSGVSWKVITILFSCIVMMISILIWLYFYFFSIFSIFIKPHQLDRFYGWLSPYQYSSGYGYQLVESLKGIGSGQLLGAGYMEGIQTQNNHIPELHTDFIFAVIGEEFGFIGATILITIYMILIYRMVIIAMSCDNLFGTYLVSGVIGFFVFQIFENIAMTIGIMPITGLPLPFVSYGGTSLLTNMAAIGIVLNVGMRTNYYMFEES